MKKYKCVNITICQVDNGFEVDFSGSFQDDVQKGNTGGIESMYVAKTEKEVIAIIGKVLPEIKKPEKTSYQELSYQDLQKKTAAYLNKVYGNPTK